MVDSEGAYNNFCYAELEDSGTALIEYRNEFGRFHTQICAVLNPTVSFISTQNRVSILGLAQDNIHVVAQ